MFETIRNCTIAAIVAVTLSGCQWREATATPTPQLPRPNIVVVPVELRAGDPIIVIGDSWQVGEEIALTLIPVGTNPSGSIAIGITRADAEGRFRFSGAIPIQSTAGPYDLLAQSSLIGRPFARASLTLLAATALLIPSATPAEIPTASPTTPPTEIPVAPPTRKVLPAATHTTEPTSTPVPATATATAIQSFPDWRGDYWNNPSLNGDPTVTRNDDVIDFNWRTGSPDPRIPYDDFSARWQRTQYFDGGTWHFTLRVDDGARLFIDDVLVIDAWQDGSRTAEAEVTLGRGNRRLRVEYYERSGLAIAQMSFNQVVPITPSPLPTHTPRPTRTPVPTAIPMATAIPPTATAIPIPMATAVPPTATAIPIPPTSLPTMPPIATAIPIATATRKPPTATRQPPTATRQPPTATAIAIATAIPIATNTPRTPATATAIPIATSTPRATATGGITATTVATFTVGAGGTLINISGARWPAGDRVTISLTENTNGLDAIVVGRRTVAANGRFALNDVLLPFKDPTIVYVITVGRSQRVVTVLVLKEPTPMP